MSASIARRSRRSTRTRCVRYEASTACGPMSDRCRPLFLLFRESQLKHSVTTSRWVGVCVLAMAAPLARAEPGISADELLGAADQVLQQFDSDHYAQVWQDVAPFVKAKLRQDQFVTSMRLARHEVGAVSKRGWASVTRMQYAGSAQVPDGLYANVDYATTRTGGSMAYEMLSFRLEPDGRWHLMGYRPREAQGANAEVATP